MENLLILSKSKYTKDPRVLRQLWFLKTFFQITIASPDATSSENTKVVVFEYPSGTLLEKALSGFFCVLRLYSMAFWVFKRNRLIFRRLNKIENIHAIIANDIEMLPIGYRLSELKNIKLVFDAHEWYADLAVGSFRLGLKQKLSDGLCKIILSRIELTTTVSPGLVDLYNRHYQTKSFFLPSCPFFSEGEVNLHTPNNNQIKLVHHGVANPNRGILELIELMAFLDSRYTLDLVLVETNKVYYQEIKSKIVSDKRIRLIEPWQQKDILKNLIDYDIGIFLVFPTTTNLKYTMPNKFFENLFSGLAIVAGPGGEMADLIEKNKVGIALKTSDLKSISQQLNSLSIEDIKEYKLKASKFKNLFNADHFFNLFIKKIL